jgi:hypothetical protein
MYSSALLLELIHPNACPFYHIARMQGGVRESALRDVLMSKANATHKEEFESQFRQQLLDQRAEERGRDNAIPEAKHAPNDAGQDNNTTVLVEARKWLVSLLFSNSTTARDSEKENHFGDKTVLPGKELTETPYLMTASNPTAEDGDGSSALLHKPLPAFGPGDKFNVPKDTGGYVTFAQRVYEPDMAPFHMPCVDTVSHLAVPCLSSKSPSKKMSLTECDNRRLLNNEALQSGKSLPLLDEEDFHDVAFRSDMELLATNSVETTLEQYDQNGKAVRPRLGSSGNKKEGEGVVEQLKLVVARKAATPFSHTPGPPFAVSIDEKHTALTLELERTVSFHGNCICILHFVNTRTSVTALVVGVFVWARDGKWLHFITAEGGGNPQGAVAFFTTNFRGGDEIQVEYVNNGMPYEKNMAVTLIEGNKYHPDFESSPTDLSIGATYRDYLVYVSCNELWHVATMRC